LNELPRTSGFSGELVAVDDRPFHLLAQVSSATRPAWRHHRFPVIFLDAASDATVVTVVNAGVFRPCAFLWSNGV
jgi:hypothetical protein